MQIDKKVIIFILIICSLLFFNSVLIAQGNNRLTLKLGTGESELLKVVDLKRVAIADPEIANVITVSDQELLVNGKSEGVTTLHLWDQKGHQSYKIAVSQKEEKVIKQIKNLIGIDTVKVAKVKENIILNGEVRNQNQLKRAKKIAKVFGEKVIDQLKVNNSLQVLLEAQVFEINKAASNELGLDWYGMRYSVGAEDGANIGSGAVEFGDRLYSKDSNGNVIRKSIPDFGLGSTERISELRTKLKALVQNNKAKLLAKPKLVTESGSEAEFVVGGEIPIVTTDSSGEQTVVWKKYGVQFEVKPTVTQTGKLDTYLHPKVSRLDWANGVEYGNGTLPAIKSSEVKTQVVIEDGATLAIGGLIQKNRTKDIKKIPLLSQLPILGELFKSKSFREGKSELIILVTPKIITSAPETKKEMKLEDILKEKEELETEKKPAKEKEKEKVGSKRGE
ncbi:type II and III secretion system protein family protein [Sporohalobacter salinus]|uniref:type II and III secretion system protein family protein n=1 Tax=Sporohalobacter salinus TaxID=1494606 RepID=UPI00195F2651|nr:pilus assembly protein N-terminal domain-containing protein [Sporohalobacter salinus]MBM7623017.1 pilus assembly protein CpaC [Sporohalobacter salinus]